MAETRALEECAVSGVGRFTAFTDGSLRVVFNDRTCLDMHGVHWERHVYDRLRAQNIVSCCLAAAAAVKVHFLKFIELKVKSSCFLNVL